MKKKSIITLVAAVVLVGVIGVGSTLAYFTDNDTQTNVVTMGHVDITLTETTEDENAVVDENGITYDDVVPGAVLSKKPVITLAKESQDAYIRAEVIAKFVNADKEEIAIVKDGEDVTEVYKEALIAACDFDSKWTKGQDGYYYYSDKLTQETNVANLFTTVTVPAAWGNEVADAQFVIEITAEAIQADNFTPAEAGWLDSEGNAITAETYHAEED